MKVVGPVRRVRLDFDRSGRSNGVATANFESHEDARDAVTRFNGKKAVGLEISVTLLEEDYGFHRRVNPGSRQNGGDRDRGRDRRSRGGPREPRENTNAPRKKTLEELDAELTSYMNGETSNEPSTTEQNAPEEAPESGPEPVVDNVDNDTMVTDE